MNLKDKLISTKPSENSGSSSSNRFDYQKNWSLCKILELHASDNEYVITFEYHDDIIILDSIDSPAKISFYQVKTKKTGNWTINQLLKIKSGAKNSMLGKLYSNKIKFPNETNSLHFVSNASFNLKIKNIAVSSLSFYKICCMDLSNTEKKKIKESLKKEHTLTTIPSYEGYTYLEVNDLTIKHHVELTRDKLAQFIEMQLPDIEYKISPIYKTIFDSIKIKSNFEDEITSYEQLIDKKSITRNDFSKMISSINKIESFKEKGQKIEHRLNSESATTNFMRNFRNNWRRLEIERLDKSNLTLKQTIQKIESIIDDLTDSDLNKSLLECTAIVKVKFMDSSSKSNFYEDDYLETIIINEIYG